MTSAIDFGKCNSDKLVYSLFTWIDGEDANLKLKILSKEKQYSLGVKAGESLRKIHTIKAPEDVENWAERFTRKTYKNISNYKSCGIILEDDEIIIKYIKDNLHLLKNRQQCFQHGDYHVGRYDNYTFK